MKILLIRSKLETIKKDYVGIGFGFVNFLNYSNIDELIKQLQKTYQINKRLEYIKDFVSLIQGDLVVVPCQKTIALGLVTNERRFNKSVRNNENQVGVRFFRDVNQNIIFIPRQDLTHGLQQNLKIQRVIYPLTKFKSEFELLIRNIELNGSYKKPDLFTEQTEIIKNKFIIDLRNKLINGNNFLLASGNGLEQLIKELLEIEGYQTKINSRNQSYDISDIDIEARKTDFFIDIHLLIQVKHHRGLTNRIGLEQLIAYKSDARKVLITTGDINDELKQIAKEQQIQIIDGFSVASWIYSNLNKLSRETKNKLGVIEIPTTLDFYTNK